MSSLKIGILTFHRCINYGSYWQAKCLVRGLRARGHHATILDHHSKKINFSEWKCAFQPVLPLPIPKSDHVLYRSKIERFLNAFEGLPLSPSFPIEEPAKMIPCDIVVVGSDEVWNLSHPWYGNYPVFYGEGVQAQHLISFAASFGNYPALQGLHHSWAEKLRNFSMISVRDENSQALLETSLGIRPALVLDPCLQFTMDDLLISPGQLFLKPYIAVYGHNFSKGFIKQVQGYSKRRGIPLISIGYRNDWADQQWIDADPNDFAHFMSHSAAVATNFFHGCVFALQNRKPFICETSAYRGNKISGLMAKINGEHHLFTGDAPPEAYERLLTDPISPSILNRIEQLRTITDDYLNKALTLPV